VNRGAELTKQPQQAPAGASQAGATSSPQWARADWISLATITALAAITRLIGLTAITGDGTPVFDEKHYAPQAFDIAVSATNPLTGGIESNPGYGLVVHPPLAKQIMAWGNTLFGYTPMGWRISAALVGILVVLAIMGLTRSLTRSTLVMTIAGLLAVFDGVLLVISRYGMLDIFQTLFVILAAWAWVLDRRDVTTRLETTIAGTTVPYQPGYPSSLQWGILGPRLGFRWWRFTTGLCLGLALSVKWSGLYYIAFFGLISVGADYWLRRRAGIRAPLPGALLRDAPSAFASLVILPIAIYAWSWRAWFASETGVYRHAEQSNGATGGLYDLLPTGISNWLYYHASVLRFHTTLTNSSGHQHPWESKPWQWLAATRPILYSSAHDLSCLGTTSCSRVVYLFGTPPIWWVTVPVLLWALWAAIARRENHYWLPLGLFLAGWLPWMLESDRQMYFFYATALVPFSIIIIAIITSQLITSDSALKRRIAQGYLALVVAAFLFFSPLLYGITVPEWYYQSMLWLPSWR